MLLIVFSSVFVPAGNLAQQPTATTSEADIIETIQRFLHQLGYHPGTIDGMLGEQTRTAIRAFQRDHHLHVDGEASMSLVEALTQATLTQAKRRPEQEQERQSAHVELTTMSPNALYVRAVQCEARDDIENALRYYQHLMKTHPEHNLAVKAADRLVVLSTSMPQLSPTPIPQPTPTTHPIPIMSTRRSTLPPQEYFEELQMALARYLNVYKKLKAQEKQSGDELNPRIIPVMGDIVSTLREIEYIYTQFPESVPDVSQKIQAARKAREAFEKELQRRQQHSLKP